MQRRQCQRQRQRQQHSGHGVSWTGSVLLAIMHVCAAGPPYLYVDGESVLFKPALFGPAVVVTGCRCVKANPRYAETPSLQNAAEIAGNVAVIDRDPPDKKGAARLSFVDKAKRAEDAGAVMAVMVNTKEEMLRPADKGGAGVNITIPVVGVPASVGAKILRSKRIDLMWDADELPLSTAGRDVTCNIDTTNEMVTQSHALFNVASGFSSAKRYPEALEFFTRAVAFHPRYADAHNNRGVELGRRKQHAAAIRAFSLAAAIEPSNRQFQANRHLAQKNAREGRRIQ